MATFDRCVRHESGSSAALEERQRALNALLRTLAEHRVCLACGCAAGMYVAAIASVRELAVPLAEFLEFAEAVYRNVDEQRNGVGPKTGEPRGYN